MRKNLLIVPLCLALQLMHAQPTSLYMIGDKEKEIRPEWEKDNKVGVDLSEVTFVNWNSGGSNSVSALFRSE